MVLCDLSMVQVLRQHSARRGGKSARNEQIGYDGSGQHGNMETICEAHFVKRFKEEGRLQYGKEMGKMVASESMKCSNIGSNGRQTDTVDLVMKLLFDHIAPPLLVAKNLSKLIAYVWKWISICAKP